MCQVLVVLNVAHLVCLRCCVDMFRVLHFRGTYLNPQPVVGRTYFVQMFNFDIYGRRPKKVGPVVGPKMDLQNGWSFVMTHSVSVCAAKTNSKHGQPQEGAVQPMRGYAHPRLGHENA